MVNISLIIDWLDMYGGTERVIREIDRMFDIKNYYSMINIMNNDDLNKIFNNKKVNVITTGLQKYGKFFRYLLPLFPIFIKQIKVACDTDTIISSSHAVAKSVYKKDTLHISYFQARNMKYLWEMEDKYFSGVNVIAKIFFHYLRRFDLKSSKIPTYIIANSKYVKEWIKRKYGRDSVVIYPPVDIQGFPLVEDKDDYYITAGRLVPYKNIDTIIHTFNKNKLKLIVAGDGNQKRYLEKIASANIIFTGFLDQKKLHSYISKAKAFIHIGIEDFGIAPVEAQACGTPVICINQGGTSETVIDKKTGVYLKEPTVESLLTAIDFFEKKGVDYSPWQIREHSKKYSSEIFIKEFMTFVEKKYKEFYNKKPEFRKQVQHMSPLL